MLYKMSKKNLNVLLVISKTIVEKNCLKGEEKKPNNYKSTINKHARKSRKAGHLH